MAAQGFIARVGGHFKQVLAILTSAGSADAGKIPGLDASGKLDVSFLPSGIGPATFTAVASEALSAGDFVNVYSNAGAFGARKADNTNARPAKGYVIAAVASAGTATIYPLDNINASRSGLTIGAEYWLGTAGGVIATALDATVSGNSGYVDQYLGTAKSATELITEDDGWTIL